MAPRINHAGNVPQARFRKGAPRGRHRDPPPRRTLVPTLSIDSLSQGSDFLVGPSMGGTFQRLT